MLNLQQHFIGTYTKNLFADFSIIAAYIQQKTVWVKDTLQPKDENALGFHLLSNQQINDALNGPFQIFFKPHLHVYTKIATIETALTVSKEDIYKESETEIDKVFNVSQDFLGKMEFSTLSQMRTKLDTLVKEHYALWESTVQNWTATVLQELKKNNVMLTEMEIQEFSINQPASELDDRLIHLKITPAKSKLPYLDFQQYFTIKATLAIHSALNRLQLPNSEKDIEAHLKNCQATLKEISKGEKGLAQTQQSPLDQLLADIS